MKKQNSITVEIGSCNSIQPNSLHVYYTIYILYSIHISISRYKYGLREFSCYYGKLSWFHMIEYLNLYLTKGHPSV